MVVVRRGDVIPKVERVVVGRGATRIGRPRSIFPDVCPECGDAPSTLKEAKDRKKADDASAPTALGPAPPQVRAGLRHFASRGAMDIDGLGTKLVDQLVEVGLVSRVSDLYTLTAYQVAQLDRMERSPPRT